MTTFVRNRWPIVSVVLLPVHTLVFPSCHARAEKLGTTAALNWGELSELPDCCELDTMPSFLLCFVPLPAVQTGIRRNLAEGDNVLVLNTVREPAWINISGCKTPERLVSPPPTPPTAFLHTYINTQTCSSCFMWTAATTCRCWQNLWSLILKVNCFHSLLKIKIVSRVYFMRDGWLYRRQWVMYI